MADPTENICPTISEDQVKNILKNDYGFINGKIQELDGYDDKNYHITVRIIYTLVKTYYIMVYQQLGIGMWVPNKVPTKFV